MFIDFTLYFLSVKPIKVSCWALYCVISLSIRAMERMKIEAEMCKGLYGLLQSTFDFANIVVVKVECCVVFVADYILPVAKGGEEGNRELVCFC